MTTTRTLHRAANFRAQSYDETSNTIELTWTTGATVRRYDFWTGDIYDETLSVEPGAVRLERLNLGAPLLDTHDSTALDKVIGSVVPGSAKVENGRGICRVLLSRADSDRDTVGKIREGIIRNTSVGYITHAEDVSKVDGVEHRTATDWEPFEISAVPVPADAGAQFRSRDGRRPDKPTSARVADIRRWAAKAKMRDFGEDHVRAGTSSAKFFEIITARLTGRRAAKGTDMGHSDYEQGKRDWAAVAARSGISAALPMQNAVGRGGATDAQQRRFNAEVEAGAAMARKALGRDDPTKKRPEEDEEGRSDARSRGGFSEESEGAAHWRKVAGKR